MKSYQNKGKEKKGFKKDNKKGCGCSSSSSGREAVMARMSGLGIPCYLVPNGLGGSGGAFPQQMVCSDIQLLGIY